MIFKETLPNGIELIAGDFLFRNSTTNANDETHVGLYLGRGMVIHALGVARM